MSQIESRRHFLKIGLAAGGGMLIGLRLPQRARADTPPPPVPVEPNAYIRIAPDNGITFIMGHVEVGQGVYTSSAMLIAEELEVGLDQIALEPAPPDEALYADPNLGEQATGGSTSTLSDWEKLRKAGAAARMMLISAAASQWRVDPASCTVDRAMVHHAASGRSVTYGQVASAAAQLPVPKDVPLKPASQFKLIGTPQKRLDTPGKVNGTLKFGMDVQVPGMKIGTVAASPVIGGKLVAIDEAAARAVPGVQDVVKLDNAVAVIGDHMWAAITGLRAAAPQWDDGPNGSADSAGIVQALDAASHSDGVDAKRSGDPRAAIGGAAKHVEAVYQLPFLAHAPMEPINTTLHIRPDGADLWVGTQVPMRAQAAVAKAAGLKPEQVTVHNQYMGGAFGRRLDVDSIEQAAAIAKSLSYPVKLVWTREEDIQHDLFRPYYYDRIGAGVDADGRIAGWTHRTTASSVMARWAPAGMTEGGKLDPDTVEGAVETPYVIPAQLNQYVRHESPGVVTAWWRGVGPTHNIFVVESFIDELAAAAGADPVTFRRRNMKDDKRAHGVLDVVVEKSGWGQPLPKRSGRGVALQFAFNSWLATVAEVSVSDRGEIALHHVYVAADVGPVVNPDTLIAQLQGGLIFGLSMAMYSEITHTKGRVDQSNFHDYRVLRMNEAPRVSAFIVHNPDAPIGGVGEAGCAAAAPALANAIFAACGRRLRRIPFGTGQLSEA
jgi:isoquinoline 1-oxidoreductase beta subunit